MIAFGMPWSSGPNISHTESTKLSTVFWQQTSPGANPQPFHIQKNRFTEARWAASTPFGVPVEPEVYMTYARSCELTPLSGLAALSVAMLSQSVSRQTGSAAHLGR